MIDKAIPSNTDDFNLVKPVGQGGMGAVYEAVDPKTTETVAVKFLDTETGNQAERASRFQREIAILQQLEHPHIVQVLASGTTDETPYFVMEFVGGGTLREKMVGALEPEEAVRIVRQIASALDYLHFHNVIHRDLKPENVLILNDGTVKLTDFGISSIVDVGPAQLTTTGQVLGTFEYMSPEQRHRLPIDYRADIYSLGVVTYEMLTGRRPAGKFRSASEWNSNVPSDVDEVLNKALAEEAEDRFKSADEFVSCLVRAFRINTVVTRTTIIALAALILAMCAALPLISDTLFNDLPDDNQQVNQPDDNVNHSEPVDKVEHPQTSVGMGAVGATTDLPNNDSPRGIGAKSEPTKLVDEKQTTKFYVNKAKLAGSKQDWSAVIECCRQALRIDPECIEALLLRGYAYHASGAKSEAFADADAVLKIDAYNVDAPGLRARMLIELGDYKEAESILSDALVLHPDDPVLRYCLGRCCYKTRKYAQAETELSDAIELAEPIEIDAPSDVYYYRALTRAKLAKWDDAHDDLKMWVKVDPPNPMAHSSLGKFLLDAPEHTGIRDYQQGLKHCRNAYNLNKRIGIVVRNYGTALLKNKQFDQAAEIANEALKVTLPAKLPYTRRLIEQIHQAKKAAEFI